MHPEHPVHRFMRAAIVAAGVSAYLAFVFRYADGQFRWSGLGDWIDPYFINGLLEHWFHVARTLANPASPPVFHPAPHVLGYSHGLVLFAPFYVLARVVLHPFHAYTATIAAVIVAGAGCLYALLRRMGGSFFESLALCALFITSANVMNGPSGVWTQRVSVFLIPVILLIALRSLRASGWRRGGGAFVAGLLTTLMYVQDFYTAHFAMLLAIWFAGAALAVHHRAAIVDNVRALLARRQGSERVAFVIGAVALTAALVILVSGGGETRLLGVRLVARNWFRPVVVAMAAAAFLIYRNRFVRSSLQAALSGIWTRAFIAGAALGTGLFLWIYLPAFGTYSSFPAAEVWRALSTRSPYWSWRAFAFAGVVAVLTWLPWFRNTRAARIHALWLVAGSIFVWLVPLRFGEQALWMAAIRPMPGFSAIRDPARIIYLYELALVLATALILRGATSRVYRAAIALAAIGLVVAVPNRERFDYGRPIAVFDRWVAGPIDIDRRCGSFFIKRASDLYMARSPSNLAALYGTDATFIAFRHSLPTLNGYSAWFPDGWELAHPEEPTYPHRVGSWISSHGLTNVCELDIDARTMRPAR